MSNVEEYLYEFSDARWKLPKKKEENPFIGYYAPDMDENPALEHDLAYCYQYLIGILM